MACTGEHSCLSFTGPLPEGISSAGLIGIGGWAKSSSVNSSVKNFERAEIGI